MKNLNLNAIIILSIFIFGIGCLIHSTHRYIDDKFTQLNNATFQIAFDSESLIENKNQKNMDNILKSLEGFIKTTYDSGKIISKPTFCKLLKYDEYVDSVVSKKSKTITLDENTAIKHDLLVSIAADQASHHTVFGGIANIFNNSSIEKYLHSDCK